MTTTENREWLPLTDAALPPKDAVDADLCSEWTEDEVSYLEQLEAENDRGRPSPAPLLFELSRRRHHAGVLETQRSDERRALNNEYIERTGRPNLDDRTINRAWDRFMRDGWAYLKWQVDKRD